MTLYEELTKVGCLIAHHESDLNAAKVGYTLTLK
jgi:hypothetical protein